MTDVLPCHIHLPVMPVHHGPSQQSCKEEYEPWKWSAAARYHASQTKTMFPTRGSRCQDSAGNRTTWRHSNHRKETQTAVVWSCLPFIRSGQNHPCKAQWKGEEDKADRGRGGKTTSGNGQTWSSAGPRGQWRTLLRITSDALLIAFTRSRCSSTALKNSRRLAVYPDNFPLMILN